MHTIRYLEVLQRLSLRRVPPLTRAVMAAAEALPAVRGAVICLAADNWRMPVAASDAAALRAEQWECTLGDGPGLSAQRSNHPVTTGPIPTEQWPVPGEALHAHTAVRAVPLPLDDGNLAAVLLLYFDRADDTETTAAAAATADIALLVGVAVAGCMADLTAQLFADRAPGKVSTPMMANRAAVTVAVGMVMADQEMTAADALDLLRAYSWSCGTVIDDTAAQLRTGTLSLYSLR